jgi:hypothetical protein
MNKLKIAFHTFIQNDNLKKWCPTAIFVTFAILFILWAWLTYRNIVHMDMMFIVGNKVKDLFEENLTIASFIYQPIFPCLISICFTFLNAYFFQLNTVIEMLLGCFFLILLGYKYLQETSIFLSSERTKILYALLIGFITFGLHKWEATFTSFFSFAIFLILCICYYYYFFIIRFVEGKIEKNQYLLLLVFFTLNLFVISESPAYYYAFILAIITLLLSVKFFNVIQVERKLWNISVIINLVLFILTFLITTLLSRTETFAPFASKLNLSDFFIAFYTKPLWIVKFYLIAHSGPFLGEATNYVEIRALFGLFILFLYAAAIYYVFKNKDRRLLVPVGLILYNIIGYGFITMGRHSMGILEYGSSSRYTAFNMSGVLGITTILFFYLLSEKKDFKNYFAKFALIVIIFGYVFVDITQLKLSPQRSSSFERMREALLTKRELDILQFNTTTSLKAIEVLKKYKLNVYANEKVNNSSFLPNKIDAQNSIALLVGTEDFSKITKSGFHENENGIAWTNGNAVFIFSNSIEASGKINILLDTYMPTICKDIIPSISIIDEKNVEYKFFSSKRKGDKFDFTFELNQSIEIKEISIKSNTIITENDKRTLSFPFKGLLLYKNE